MQHLLETEELVCGYDSPILGPLELEVPPEKFVLITGPNGIGKSTLLRTIAGLNPPLAGTFRWDAPIESRRFVPQVRTLDPVLPATVADVVETGAIRGSGLQGMRGSVTSQAIDEVLERVEMTDYRSHLFRELSEGQKQLVLLARALVGNAQVMLLDEPTASMDPNREERALDLMERGRDERGLAIFLIAHGSQRAREMADLILNIDRNREVELQAPRT